MAALDYVVFEPNYRGSDNLGNTYQRAIYNDAGDGPGRDVMAGVEAIKKLGFVDESKIAVTDWSYGGYMTCPPQKPSTAQATRCSSQYS